MRTRRNLWALAAIPLAVAAVALGSAPGCGGTSVSGKPRPDGGPICSNGSGTCAAGTVCNNGDCVPSCDSSGNCPTGYYCEGPAPRNVCAPVAMTACTIDQDCPLPQFCQSGLCVSYEVRADGGLTGCLLSGNDGCAGEAICYQVQNATTGLVSNTCVGLPACSQDGTCPVGNAGSVCNGLPDGGYLLDAKQRICMYSLCRTGANCPAGYECFHSKSTSELGGCSLGTPGSACFTIEDCFNATNCVGADGGIDAGGTPGLCQ